MSMNVLAVDVFTGVILPIVAVIAIGTAGAIRFTRQLPPVKPAYPGSGQPNAVAVSSDSAASAEGRPAPPRWGP